MAQLQHAAIHAAALAHAQHMAALHAAAHAHELLALQQAELARRAALGAHRAPALASNDRLSLPPASIQSHPTASAVDAQQWLPLKPTSLMRLSTSFEHLGLVEGLLAEDERQEE